MLLRSRSPRSRRPSGGFTVIELVAVIALIALLLALLLVAFSRATGFANRTTSLGALRQLATAVNTYASEHDQALPPGQVSDAELARMRLKAFTNDERATPVDPAYANTWVWRLAPYTSDGWSVAMADDRDRDVVDGLAGDLQNADAGVVATAYETIENRPSIGMNTFFLGGDDVQGDDDQRDLAPWRGGGFDSPAARTITEVRNPSQLMVFAPTVAVADATAANFDPSRPLQGAASLRPPFLTFDDSSSDPQDHVWIDRQWQAADPEFTRIAAGPDGVYDLSTRASGWPVARWGDEAIVPCAHLDGSTSALELSEYFFDMRLWAPRSGTQRFRVDAP